MDSFTLEVCVDSLDAALAALRAGADRIEVCSRLDLDGLTPEREFLTSLRAQTTVPLMAMVRPRPSAFVPDSAEWAEMRDDLRSVLDCGADGVVFGALTTDAELPTDELASLREICAGHPVTFHRAFDHVHNPHAAWQELEALGFDRVLTSGRPGRAADHLELLAELAHSSKNCQLRLLPGGGIRPANAAQILRRLAPLGVNELHSSQHLGWGRNAPRAR